MTFVKFKSCVKWKAQALFSCFGQSRSGVAGQYLSTVSAMVSCATNSFSSQLASLASL